MTKDPWTDPDPQPGDFDAELASTNPHDLQVVDAGSGGKVRLLVSVEGEDAARLTRLAEQRGQRPSEVVSTLLRSA